MKPSFLLALCLTANAAQAEIIRVASYNASLSRSEAGALTAEIEAGNTTQIESVAQIINEIGADLLLINEFDYEAGQAQIFNATYLKNAYPFTFEAPSNTGLHSGMDLDGNGKITDRPGSFNYAKDAFGFGMFPGQYGMAVFSKYEILTDEIRTFQMFRWADMPDARRPLNPNGTPYYPDSVWQNLRLSSKSHWDVPVRINGKTLHFLVSHPTPPVFDGPEDKNGTRNADEIRFWADYIAGADYMTDDQGRKGGLETGAFFVIAGDLNADPFDGDSTENAARQILEHDLVNTSLTPSSEGAIEASEISGMANRYHKGNPAFDTADWNDEGPGNLRVDYVLPAATLNMENAGVFWPPRSDPKSAWISASDHRAVWVDIKFPD